MKVVDTVPARACATGIRRGNSNKQRGSKMLEKITETILQGTLHDIFPVGKGEVAEEVFAAFAGKPTGVAIFTVPGALGTYREVFFDNREMLARFASLSLDSQREFLRCVCYILKEQDVEETHLTVRWSEQKTRVLRIRSRGLNFNGSIDIFLL